MFTVRVEADFAAAHFLSHYQGKCERLHGHNYRVRVWVQGHSLSEGGMLADFGVLKDALRKIVGALDHTNLNDNAVFMNDPSAERIARYIFQELYGVLPSYGVDAELLSAVDVYETPVNMARYEKDPVETAATETIPHFND